METSKIFFVTVDVEEDLGIGARNPIEFEGITQGLPSFFEILDSLKIKATFFTTGEVGLKFPEITKEMGTRYELACHGLWHRLITEFDLATNREHIIQNAKIFNEITGHRPLGFRAVNNVINNRFLNLLEELGFRYDSSALSNYPYLKKYIGFEKKTPNFPYYPSRTDCRKRGESRILEMPISTIPIINVPWVGTWIRTLGKSIYKLSALLSEPSYIMLTLHSWDFIDLKGKTSYSRKSGSTFAKDLGNLLSFFYSKDYKFLTLVEGCKKFEQ